MPVELDFDPQDQPDKYRLIAHRNGTFSSVLRKRPKRALKTAPPAPPELLAELAQRFPLPPTLLKKPRDHAQTVGDAYFWSARGCKHHGSPALRFTNGGNCVMCDKDIAEERKAATQRIKAEARIPLDKLPRSQLDAIAIGCKRYFDGKPCRNGHIAERYTRTKQCLHCLADSQGRAYTLPPVSTEMPPGMTPLPAARPPHFNYYTDPADHAPKPAPAVQAPLQPTSSPFLDDLDRQLGLTQSHPGKP